MALRPRHLQYAARLLLSSAPSPDGFAVVPIRPDGDRPPLFFVPGIGGEVVGFGTLAHHLPPGQPVLGLGGLGPDLPRRSALRMEAIGENYSRAIRRAYPSGPYLIAGYSAGGILAYEVAQQLRAAGGDVSLLAMIDAEVPPELPRQRSQRRHWTPAEAFRFARNVGYWIADDLMTANAADLLLRTRSKARLLRSKLPLCLPVVPGVAAPVDIRDRLALPRFPDHFVPWLEAYLDAIEHYDPEPYPGRIVVVRARTLPVFGSLQHDRGWGALARRRVDVRVIPGEHTNILREPRVRLLAAALADVIDQGLAAGNSYRRLDTLTVATRI